MSRVSISSKRFDGDTVRTGDRVISLNLLMGLGVVLRISPGDRDTGELTIMCLRSPRPLQNKDIISCLEFTCRHKIFTSKSNALTFVVVKVRFSFKLF